MEKGKKEIIYSFLFSWSSKFITYFLLLILANLYLADSYGKSSFILAIFNLILFFCVMGLADIFVPWSIQNNDTSSVFYFLLLLNGFFVILGIFILPFYPLIFPLIIALPFVFFYYLGIAILRIKYKYHISKFFDIIFIFITLVSVFFLKNLNEFGIILGYSIGHVISSLCIIFVTRKEIFKIISTFKLNYSVIKKYIKKGFITSLLVLSFYFLNWLDSIVLGLLSTFENVARYNIASSISNGVSAIPISLSLFLLTRTSNLLKSNDFDTPIRVLTRILRISYSLSLILAIFVASFLPLLFKIFFPKYVGVEIYTILLFMGILFFSLYNPIYTYFIGELRPEKAFFPIVFASIFNLIFDIILIPRFGIFGICIATLLAHALAFTLLGLKFGVLKKFIMIYPLSLFVLVSFYIGYYGIFLIPIVLVLMFLFNLINKEDIVIIKNTIFKTIKI